MNILYLNELKESVYKLAVLAFREDLPSGDVTAEALNFTPSVCSGHIFCREEVVMAGTQWVDVIVTAGLENGLKGPLQVQALAEDGQLCPADSVLYSVKGSTEAVLGFERPFLNFLARSLGIAKMTGEFVALARESGSSTQILDTRKTLPGFRFFDKYAVLCGGGKNHRMSLSDQVLIKENHIARHGGVSSVLSVVKDNLKKPVKVEIEVQDLDECKEAIEAGCDIIMLDNFTPDQVHEACKLKPPTIEFEVSGGIDKSNIKAYCQAGVDRISIGGLTHSVKAPDISLLVEEELKREHSNGLT